MRVLPERYRLLTVLYGLVNACGNNPKTENTDTVVLESLRLFAELSDSAAASEAEDRQIAAIRDEKNAVVPDCAVCTHPCGNTSDLNPSALDRDPDEVFSEKKHIAELCGKAACAVLEGGVSETVSVHLTECCYRGVCWFGLETDTDSLNALADCFYTVGIK